MEALLLAASCSLDAFVASIAYGTNKVKIPFVSIQIINLVCSSILAISLFFGSIVKRFLPGNISTIISFTGLLLLGGRYIVQSIIKSYAEKNKNSDKSIKFKLYDLGFVLNIYVSESEEESNSLKSVKSKEAFYLAAALSLDSLAVGFASALGNINYKQVVLFSLITDAVAVWAGLFLGRKFVEKTKLNLSWLSGLILIGLAFLKLK